MIIKNSHLITLGIFALLLFSCNFPSEIMTPVMRTPLSNGKVEYLQSQPSITVTNAFVRTNPSNETSKPPLDLETQINKKTFFLDQKGVDQYCLKYPQSTLNYPELVDGDYMVAVWERNNISALSLPDGTLTPLITPEYSAGHLLGNVEFNAPWYSYIMVDSPSGNGDWALHVTNLKTREDKIIANREEYGSSALHFYASISSGTIYFSTSNFDRSKILSSNVYSVDLTSGKKEILIESKEELTFMSILAVSGRYLIVENDPIQDYPLSFVSLFDIENKSWIELPQSSPSSMPDIDYPYAVWKNGHRYSEPLSFTTYNIDSGESIIHSVVGGSSFDLTISDGYVITQASTGEELSRNSVILYSLNSADVYAIRLGIEEILIHEAHLSNGKVVWAFRTMSSSVDYSGYLCSVPMETVTSESKGGIEY